MTHNIGKYLIAGVNPSILTSTLDGGQQSASNFEARLFLGERAPWTIRQNLQLV